MKYKVGDCFIDVLNKKIRIIEEILIDVTRRSKYRYYVKDSIMVWYEYEIDRWLKLPDTCNDLYS